MRRQRPVHRKRLLISMAGYASPMRSMQLGGDSPQSKTLRLYVHFFLMA
jgi:hypothetical protein